ncbi:MAG: hypothetical protein RR633_01930 [Acinetobacter sp.]
MSRKTQQDMHVLMQHFHAKTLPENGLRYSERLFQITANYSDESLDQLDQLLIDLHHQNVRPNDLVAEFDGLKFLMSISGYLCETINQRTSTETEWYNYHEAIKILPSDYNLPLDFFSSMVAIIEKQVCLPLGVLQDLLYQGTESKRNCKNYVENRCETINQSKKRDTNEMAKQYLSALQNNTYMPGGNYYRSSTDLIDFDFSIRSVAELDVLLQSIRETELLTEHDFASFFQNREKLNFLIGMTYYLGAVIAHLGQNSLKWFDFAEYKARFSNEPDLEFRHEFDQVCVTEDRMSFPMTVLTTLLFDSSANNQSCVAYIQKQTSDLQSGPIRYFPSSLRFATDASLPPNIQTAFAQAGFFAAYASFMMQGSSFPPMVLVPEGEKINIVKEMSDNARSEILKKLDENIYQHPYLIFCEDIHAYPPSGRTDAIYMKIRVYDTTPIDLTLIIPYQPKTATQAEKVFSAIRYTESDIPEHLLNPAMAEFYKQAFEFINAFTHEKLWEECFEEHILLKPLEDAASEDHLHKFKTQIIAILNTHQKKQSNQQAYTPEASTHAISNPSIQQQTATPQPQSTQATLASHTSTRAILAVLDDADNTPQQKQEAVALLKTKALQHDIDAMQVIAYFYANGKYVERNPKQALYNLIEVAKVKLDEESFNTAMGFFAAPENGIHAEDKEAESWLLDLAARYDQATQEKPSFDKSIPQNNTSTTRARRQQKQALDGTQWFIRIGIGLVILLFLIIIFK